MEPSLKRATVYFEASLHRALKRLAADTGRTVSELANQAVKGLLEGSGQEELASARAAAGRSSWPGSAPLGSSLAGPDLALLTEIARQAGSSVEELVSQAASGLIRDYRRENRLRLLRQGKGLWQGRKDLPGIGALRREVDRE